MVITLKKVSFFIKSCIFLAVLGILTIIGLYTYANSATFNMRGGEINSNHLGIYIASYSSYNYECHDECEGECDGI